MVRFVLAEPQAIVREGFRLIALQEPDWEVVGEAGDGATAVKVSRRLRPDLLITETSLPGLSGLDVAGEVSQGPDAVAVLFLSSRKGSQLVRAALQAGARGFVTKDSSPKDLVRAIRTVLRGGRFLSPDLMPEVIDALTGRLPSQESGIAALTQRERQVLQLIAEGLSSKEIAGSMCVSPRTVESYRASLMQRLDIHKVSGLVRFAIREGLVEA